MSATIQLRKTTGTSGSEIHNIATAIGYLDTDITSTVITSYPITIPTSGSVYSYENWLSFYCSIAPATSCTNFRVWKSSGTVDTGVTIYSGQTDTYATPINTVSSVATTDVVVYDSIANSLSVPGSLTDADQSTEYFIFQLKAEYTASKGTMSQQTYGYAYDEI